MTENVEVQGEQPDNAVIKALRDQVSKLEKEAKNARSQVEREYQAKDLMPAQYEGLTAYFVQETDGDVTPEAVNDWLAGRGLAVTPSEATQEEQPDTAQELAEVADLGSSVAAAASTTPTDTLNQSIQQINEKYAKAGPGSLTDLTAELAALVNPPE